jgi:hypothetical protein
MSELYTATSSATYRITSAESSALHGGLGAGARGHLRHDGRPHPDTLLADNLRHERRHLALDHEGLGGLIRGHGAALGELVVHQLGELLPLWLRELRPSLGDDVLEDAVAEVARLEGLAARDELHADVDGVPRISSLELLDRSIRGAGMGQG